MNLLAIDTTEAACSAALLLDGAVMARFEVAPRRHSALILPMMEDLLRAGGVQLGELDALAFARGPGSFTGVRIAAAIAQGAAFGAGLPVVPVSSLQALAAGHCRRSGAEAVLVALDARMREIYWGAFERAGDELPQPMIAEAVCAADQVIVPARPDWQGAGSGWGPYREILERRCDGLGAVDATAQIEAVDVAALAAASFAAGEAVAAEDALPVYLRDEVAWASPNQSPAVERPYRNRLISRDK